MQLWLEEPTAEWSWDRLGDASHIALARLKLNVDFIDIGKQYSLLVENGVLNYVNKFVDAPDATLTLTKDTLDNIQLKQSTMDQAIESGVRSRSTGTRRLSPTSSVSSIPISFWFKCLSRLRVG